MAHTDSRVDSCRSCRRGIILKIFIDRQIRGRLVLALLLHMILLLLQLLKLLVRYNGGRLLLLNFWRQNRWLDERRLLLLRAV
jgi:hypothetical protein